MELTLRIQDYKYSYYLKGFFFHGDIKDNGMGFKKKKVSNILLFPPAGRSDRSHSSGELN